MTDQRDEVTWAALELTRLGETFIEENRLESTLRKDLSLDPEHPVFIPSTVYWKNGRKVTVHLMEGYAFVGTGPEDTEFFRLEDKPYIAKVMSRKGSVGYRVLCVINNDHVEGMRMKLREITSESIIVGATVKVTEGSYRSLEGDVLGYEGDYVFVKIDLRSLSVITRLPRVFLEILDDEGSP